MKRTGTLATVDETDSGYKVKADAHWVQGGFVCHGVGLSDDGEHAGERHVGLALHHDGETSAFAIPYALAAGLGALLARVAHEGKTDKSVLHHFGEQP